jgi:histidinol dehydrogenase
MTAVKATGMDELRMSGKEFDRIMSQALRVKPEDAKKPKRSIKAKTTRKKKTARK